MKISNSTKLLLFFAAINASLCWGAGAQEANSPQTLITNVHVFDGVNEARIENASVLIEGNLIAAVSTGPVDADGATVIDGGGTQVTATCRGFSQRVRRSTRLRDTPITERNRSDI